MYNQIENSIAKDKQQDSLQQQMQMTQEVNEEDSDEGSLCSMEQDSLDECDSTRLPTKRERKKPRILTYDQLGKPSVRYRTDVRSTKASQIKFRKLKPTSHSPPPDTSKEKPIRKDQNMKVLHDDQIETTNQATKLHNYTRNEIPTSLDPVQQYMNINPVYITQPVQYPIPCCYPIGTKILYEIETPTRIIPQYQYFYSQNTAINKPQYPFPVY